MLRTGTVALGRMVSGECSRIAEARAILPYYWSLVETMWGIVGLAGDGDRLWYAGFPEDREEDAVAELGLAVGALGEFDPGALAWAEAPIRAYFSGALTSWAELPVRLRGTAFQVAVWTSTRDIPFGEVRTYGEIARLAGYPGAHRAAGTALSQNPAGLLVPCHRVIASNGIGGYGRWLPRKRALLRLEGFPVERFAADESGAKSVASRRR